MEGNRKGEKGRREDGGRRGGERGRRERKVGERGKGRQIKGNRKGERGQENTGVGVKSKV